MPETSDFELLAQFVRDNSEASFCALVERHVNLVYSVALRCTRNPHAAGEITQAVFIILAHKARSLSQKTILSGWLHQVARLTAANYLRAEIRRRHYEQEAFMQSTLIGSASDDVWRELAPLLDEAIGRLRNQDRDALVLRFFEKKSLSEVGRVLGIKERAAQKRVDRAVEKLRKYFIRRGVALTTVIIAGVVSANSIQAAPVALAKAVTSAVLTKGAAGAGSTLLIQATLKLMAWSKAKMAVAVSATVLLAGSVITTTLFSTNHSTNQTDDYERYQITGDVTYQTYHPSTNSDCNFTLIVNGSNWAIHITGLEPKLGIKYEDEVHLNGSVYVYSHFEKPPPGSPARNSGIANVYRRQTAVMGDPYYAWLGLASGDYFSRLTNDEIEPSLPDLPVPVRLRARWQLNDQYPYLPKSIEFYQGPIEGILLRPGVVMHQFDNGWKRDQLRVLQETNIAGEIFPLVYTYEGFSPNLKSNVVEPQFLSTVHVRTIKLHSVPDVLTPRMEGETLVTDHRISNTIRNELQFSPLAPAQSLMYVRTAGRLPQKPDVEAAKKLRQHLASSIRGAK